MASVKRVVGVSIEATCAESQASLGTLSPRGTNVAKECPSDRLAGDEQDIVITVGTEQTKVPVQLRTVVEYLAPAQSNFERMRDNLFEVRVADEEVCQAAWRERVGTG